MLKGRGQHEERGRGLTTRFTYLTQTKDGQGSRRISTRKQRRLRLVVDTSGFTSRGHHCVILGKLLYFPCSEDTSLCLSVCLCLSHPATHWSGLPIGMTVLHALAPIADWIKWSPSKQIQGLSPCIWNLASKSLDGWK